MTTHVDPAALGAFRAEIQIALENPQWQDFSPFTNIMRKAHEDFCLEDRMLACELEVSIPTVNRWRRGKSTPSRFAWKPIFDTVMKRIDEQLTSTVGTAQSTAL